MWDAYANNQNNYYVYRSTVDSKLRFIPWGTDDGFTNTMPFPPFRIVPRSVHAKALLPVRLYALPEVQKLYRGTLERVLDTAWKEEQLYAVIDAAVERLRDHLHPTQRDFPGSTSKIRKFIRSRRRVIQRELARWPVKIDAAPRRPYYGAEIARATGSFRGMWSGPKDPQKAVLELKLRGEVVEFRELRVTIARSTWPTLDGQPGPPTITFAGRRASDSRRLTLAFSPDAEDFRPDSGPVRVQGVFFEGRQGKPEDTAWNMVSGIAEFTEGTTEPGAACEGRVTLRIVGMRGGEPASFPAK